MRGVKRQRSLNTKKKIAALPRRRPRSTAARLPYIVTIAAKSSKQQKTRQKPGEERVAGKSSSSDIQGPTLAGSYCFFAGRNRSIAGSATDVEGLGSGHSRQTSKKLDKVGPCKSSGNHVDATTCHAGIIGNAKSRNHFLNGRSDLPSNNIAISFVAHGASE